MKNVYLLSGKKITADIIENSEHYADTYKWARERYRNAETEDIEFYAEISAVRSKWKNENRPQVEINGEEAESEDPFDEIFTEAFSRIAGYLSGRDFESQ